jgi:Zn-dependent membrane protease YugP
MLFDPVFLLFMLPGLALSLWASYQVRSTFKRFQRVGSRQGLTGARGAQLLLERHGVAGVRIEPTRGTLSDHYDPGSRMLRLSSEVYRGTSLAALGVAAHEAGHAMQHAQGYWPLRFRSLIVKPASIGSNLGIILAALGLLVDWAGLLWLGVILFSAFVVFTLATLPVEFDASGRAMAALRDQHLPAADELDGARRVLRAAGLTYVAAAATAVLQLLYFVLAAQDR